MTNTFKPFNKETEKAAMAYALGTLEKMPKSTPED